MRIINNTPVTPKWGRVAVSVELAHGTREGWDKLTGMYEHTIDAKGRLFIPMRLREELGDPFYVTLSMEKCLTAYSIEGWAKFKEKMQTLPIHEKSRLRPLFTHASKCDLDSQGRILLTQYMRKYAELDKNVTVVGVDEYAEFWDSERWAKVDAAETTPENIAGVFKELDI